MPARQFGNNTVANTTITTTTETVVASVVIGSTNGPNVPVSLDGWVDLTTGLGTTGITLRLRRGTDITGTVVIASSNEAVGAATTGFDEIIGVDTPGDVGPQSYVFTVQQAAATGNGTVNKASIQAVVGP